MNVIAAPKTGKSWLTIDLAVSLATGGLWLGQFQCEPCSVLILDNELHSETCADRFPQVATARGIGIEAIGSRVYVETLRGRLLTTHYLRQHLEAVEPGRFKVIVLDAFYRFMPAGFSENDNGQMASVYNELDRIAERLKCCFVLVHHSSKGDQGGKAVTDVGAGAGAQSRATDSHLVLRSHEEDGVVVLDASVRSWPPVEPTCLRWSHPVWKPAADLDPTKIRRNQSRSGRGNRSEASSEAWTVARFVHEMVVAEPRTKAQITARCETIPHLSNRRAGVLLNAACGEGLIESVTLPGRGGPQGFRLKHAEVCS
jgi:hypothetical protein